MSSITTLGTRSNFGLFAQAPNQPAAMTQTRRTQRDQNPPPADPKERDKGWTGGYRIVAGGKDFVLRHHSNEVRDAGRALPVAENADLWLVRFAYTTHKAQEAWLGNPPADGKLVLNVVCTPSWHVGNTDAEKQKNGEEYSKTNVYVVEIVHRDAAGRMNRISQVEFKVQNPPEYASMSPRLEVDLNKYKGDIIVRGWAKGSGGVGGYIEARETIIHNP
jgi:hypothetical protein